ncbi:MAG: CUAEP/CCAEP-tail radical SAM protein, partial [Planctomycetaceae bacterium]
MRANGSILLISCYELGHQPLGVAMPIGFLNRAGYSPQALDIAVEDFDIQKVSASRFVGISVPMHTAMRLGVRVAGRIRETNPNCHICFYGIYAALNSDYLLEHGADSCIGGEYETPLVSLVDAIQTDSENEIPGVIQRDRNSGPYLHHLEFAMPDRTALPGLDRYAHLDDDGQCRVAGYVEATRGCLHMCTHCPIPPVYEGRFFAVPEEVVLEDIRRQVKSGATHISFGDPDFLNGPKHSLRVVRAMHSEFPSLTFDFTAKIEHLLKRGQDLRKYAAAGCLFIISAVESTSDTVLNILAKEHTHDEFVQVLDICRAAGIPLRPTWVAFTPWTTLDDYQTMLSFVEANG